jgi:hypothetical protein
MAAIERKQAALWPFNEQKQLNLQPWGQIAGFDEKLSTFCQLKSKLQVRSSLKQLSTRVTTKLPFLIPSFVRVSYVSEENIKVDGAWTETFSIPPPGKFAKNTTK